MVGKYLTIISSCKSFLTHLRQISLLNSITNDLNLVFCSMILMLYAETYFLSSLSPKAQFIYNFGAVFALFIEIFLQDFSTF